MFLVPLKPDESFEFLDFIPESVLPKVRTENYLLGVFVIAKTGNVLFPPEVLESRLLLESGLPPTTTFPQESAGIETNVQTSSRQESAFATGDIGADQSDQFNGTDSHSAPPSEPTLPTPPW